MHTGSRSLQTMLAMEPRRRQDINEIEALAREQQIEAVVALGIRNELAPARFGPLSVRVAERDNLNLRNAQPTAEMIFRNHSTADDSAAQLGHFLRSLFYLRSHVDDRRDHLPQDLLLPFALAQRRLPVAAVLGPFHG